MHGDRRSLGLAALLLSSFATLATGLCAGCTTPLPLLEIDAGRRTDAPSLDAPVTPGLDAPITPDSDAPGLDVPASDAPLGLDAPGAIGATCTDVDDCALGHCVDGFCCDTPCAGICTACSGALTDAANGTCAPVTAGADPADECAVAGPGGCGSTGACDGAGACARPAPGTPCGTATCAGVDQLAQPTCDDAGACRTGALTSCGAYRCRSNSCLTSCMGGIDCAGGANCDLGVCAGERVIGENCSRPSDCTSGFCVDNHCCDTACTGLCSRCDGPAITGAAAGTCAAIQCSDPDNECSTVMAPTCVVGMCGTGAAC